MSQPQKTQTTLPSYAETQGQAFDWWYALENPGCYSRVELCKRAFGWVTCACGNQCALIPRWPNGAPRDKLLQGLGQSFHAAVWKEHWVWAKLCLFQIESRSAELIAEILSK